jgi:transcriptional regulator with XRE-family HTH domain
MAAKRSGAAPPLPVDAVLRGVLGKNLRDARTRIGLTQQALADLSGISRKYIGEIERGVANVSIDMLSVIAKHVDSSPIDLLRVSAGRVL